MTRLAPFLIVVVLGCSACGTAPLTPGGEKVRLVESEPLSCHSLGDISKSDTWGGDRERTLHRAMNEAADRGADTMMLDEFSGGGGGQVHIKGRIYRCSK